jgi:CubicO group peptidase (beta-lactamase class C family)
VAGPPSATCGVIIISGGADSYGYLWWLGRRWNDSRSFAWIGGGGYGGQRLYVVPSEDLVVSLAAGVFRRSYDQGLAGETALNMALRATIGH